MLKSGGGEISVKKLRELTTTLSEEEHDEYHKLLDYLRSVGAAKFTPEITKIGDKGLIISRKLIIKEPIPHRPRSPMSPIIVTRKH